MTPLEIFEYKNSWATRYSVSLHSDAEDRGIQWCKNNLQKHQWDISRWTDVYEHTFDFEDEENAEKFKIGMSVQNGGFDIEDLDPAKRSWYYDGYGVKRKKE
jgi:hypothetical protein